MKGSKGLRKTVPRLTIWTLTLMLLLMPCFAEAKGGNDLTATLAGSEVIVDYQARAGSYVESLHLHAEAVQGGRLLGVWDNAFDLTTPSRTYSDQWAFALGAPDYGAGIASQPPEGTVLTVYMLVYGVHGQRPKIVSTTLTF